MKKLLKTLLIGIIICISGTTCVEAASLYNVNNYQLPLGTVKVVNNLYLFALYSTKTPYHDYLYYSLNKSCISPKNAFGLSLTYLTEYLTNSACPKYTGISNKDNSLYV